MYVIKYIQFQISNLTSRETYCVIRHTYNKIMLSFTLFDVHRAHFPTGSIYMQSLNTNLNIGYIIYKEKLHAIYNVELFTFGFPIHHLLHDIHIIHNFPTTRRLFDFLTEIQAITLWLASSYNTRIERDKEKNNNKKNFYFVFCTYVAHDSIMSQQLVVGSLPIQVVKREKNVVFCVWCTI